MSETLLTCDLCPKAVFHSKQALAVHASEKHREFVPDADDLSELAAMISPRHKELSEQMSSKWRDVGCATFALASRRDAGPERLSQACDARAQLELVAREWRSSAEVYVFGSSVAMGIWDGLSDIDCTVVDVAALEQSEWPPNEKTAVRNFTEILRKIGFGYSNLEAIEHARVPIIKHNAHLPAIKILGKDYERILARSMRCVFDEAQQPDARLQFEVALRGVCEIETVWWDADGRSCGLTLQDTTMAVKALLFVASSFVNVRSAPLHNELRPELFHVDFDLSFRTFGIRNSHLLRSCLMAHRCGRPGALVLKDWSKRSGVNNSINGFLTSYAINIMWIYFLVQKGHIEHVSPTDVPHSLASSRHSKDPEYKELVPREVAGGSTAEQAMFEEMGRLLFEFFAFYCFEFDWQRNVVSLNRSGVTSKVELGWTEDDEVRLAKRNVRYSMCIEDPYEENLNLGRHLGENRCRKVMAELRRGLVSLVKDEVDGTVVLGPSQRDTGPAAEPRLGDVTRLLSVAVTSAESYSASEFREVLTNRCPEELDRVLASWTWDELVRRLGFKQVAGHVFPIRPVSTRKRPASPSTMTATEPGGTKAVDRMVESLVERRKQSDGVLPEWMLWQHPAVSIPTSPPRTFKTSALGSALSSMPRHVVRSVV